MASAEPQAARARAQLRILFVPLASPGHLLPMFDIARLFSTQGAESTLILTPSTTSLLRPFASRSSPASISTPSPSPPPRSPAFRPASRPPTPSRHASSASASFLQQRCSPTPSFNSHAPTPRMLSSLTLAFRGLSWPPPSLESPITPSPEPGASLNLLSSVFFSTAHRTTPPLLMTCLLSRVFRIKSMSPRPRYVRPCFREATPKTSSIKLAMQSKTQTDTSSTRSTQWSLAISSTTAA